MPSFSLHNCNFGIKYIINEITVGVLVHELNFYDMHQTWLSQLIGTQNYNVKVG